MTLPTCSSHHARFVAPTVSVPPSCTSAFGRDRLSRLLAALSAGDEGAVEALIITPSPGRDGLELAPTLRAFLAGDRQTDLAVHSRADLDMLMGDVRGFRLEIVDAPARIGTGFQTGPDAWTGPAVALGPVMWRAASVGVVAGGHRYIVGGGKVLIACPSGKVVRAVLSPAGFQ